MTRVHKLIREYVAVILEGYDEDYEGRQPIMRKHIGLFREHGLELEWRGDAVYVVDVATQQQVGHVMWVEYQRPSDDLSDECLADVEALQKQVGSRTPVGMVSFSELPVRYRGKGMGYAMYEMALGLSGLILVPNFCASGYGVTSPDAARVWDKLKQQYKNAGDAVYGY